MSAVALDDLLTTLDFVSGAPMENRAYVCRDTGRVYWKSDIVDVVEEPPPDLNTSDRYVAIPTKQEMGLGRDLALRFAREALPGSVEAVYGFFRRRGAYARFKQLLEREDALEKWYAFENAAVEERLVEWCREHGLDVVK